MNNNLYDSRTMNSDKITIKNLMEIAIQETIEEMFSICGIFEEKNSYLNSIKPIPLTEYYYCDQNYFDESNNFKLDKFNILRDIVNKLNSIKVVVDELYKVTKYIEYYNIKNLEFKSDAIRNFEQFPTVNSIYSLAAIIYINHNSRDFESAIFEHFFEFWWNHFDSPFIYSDLYIPLLYCYFDCDEIIIDENWSIVKMSHSVNAARLYNLSFQLNRFDKFSCHANYALKYKDFRTSNHNSFERYKNYGGQHIDSIIDRACLILFYLFDVIKYHIGIDHFIFHTKSALFFSSGDLPHIYLSKLNLLSNEIFNKKRIFYNTPFNISVTQIDLIKLTNYLPKKLNDTNVLAINRYFKSAKNNSTDGIIDISIGLEALLCRKQSNTALNMRLRAAMICSKNIFFDYSADKILNEMHNFYKLRNELVHGNSRYVKSYPVDNHFQSYYEFGMAMLKHIIKYSIENENSKILNQELETLFIETLLPKN